MEVELHEVAKRYRFEWIFKNISYSFLPGKRYAVLGNNGTGKSTLLRILSGHLTPSKGKIIFSQNGKPLEIDQVYRKVAYAAPYIDLIEEFTLKEAIDFHQKFKPLLNNLNTKQVIELLGFEKSTDKSVKFFSSGMKQRLKLALAMVSQSSILLLDEPTTNLDQQGMSWYQELLRTYAGNRLVIIASNIEADYQACDHFLNIMDYK